MIESIGELSIVDKVIFGNCFSPLEQNVARNAAYKAGIPENVPGFSINGTCGSSMQAVISAAQAVQCGEADVVLAGGVESMSNAPYIMESARWGQRIRHLEAYDLLWKGMQEYPIGVGMGLTAENLAEKYSNFHAKTRMHLLFRAISVQPELLRRANSKRRLYLFRFQDRKRTRCSSKSTNMSDRM